MRHHPDWIEAYLRYTDNTEPPSMFREWVAVSSIAAVMQRKIYLSWGELTFYPNMYVVLVAPSGKARKSTAMSTGAKLMRELGIKLAAEAITREALIQELAKAIDQSPSGEIHSSLTVYSSELVVFLGYDNKQLMADLADWYDCAPQWTYRTKNVGTDEIIGVWVNLIGATTPELIQSALPRDAIGGGLASRMVFVFEERKGKSVPAPFLTPADDKLRQELKEDLEAISLIEGKTLVSKEFVEAWTEWYVGEDMNPSFKDPNFSGYIERRPSHVLKLCMIKAAAMGSMNAGNLYLTPAILEKSIDLLGRTEVKMPRTFMGYGQSTVAAVTTRIMQEIAAKGLTSRGELMRIFYADFDSAQQMDKVLEVLGSIGFCKIYPHNNRTMVEFNPNSQIGKSFTKP